MSTLKDSAKVCDLYTPASGKPNNYDPVSVCQLWCFSLSLSLFDMVAGQGK